ncbi:MAG: LytTR family DNA-binding domain-containing protein, partial [Maribacter dokdonensis]|uniref:LytTR family DNA-binding domain-containing protein n=1 Tax=Maribacter dokdonensis TaxID=320912 RepID=UPI003299266E
YYKSPLYNGLYSFSEFFNIIMIKSTLILSPIILLVRRYSTKLIPIKQDILTIKGENKLDILKIHKSDLICISNAHNYIEVFFIQNNHLNSKLIRSSLVKIQNDLDFLVQTHRSHLMNPTHFRSWKNSNTIQMTEIEIPVSKKYKHRVLFLSFHT